MKVLVVDDCPLTVEDLKEFLRGNRPSIQVASAGTEKDALIKAAHWLPNAVITDLHLQTGSGFQVVKEMKALRPTPTVIVLTNYALPRYRDLARLSGADYFFDKSLGFGELLKAIDSVSLDRFTHAAQFEDPTPEYLGPDIFSHGRFSTDAR